MTSIGGYRSNQTAFFEACLKNRLVTAKWMLKTKENINISADNDFLFAKTCGEGSLEVAQWLLKVKPDINICAYQEYAFKFACLTDIWNSRNGG